MRKLADSFPRSFRLTREKSNEAHQESQVHRQKKIPYKTKPQLLHLLVQNQSESCPEIEQKLRHSGNPVGQLAQQKNIAKQNTDQQEGHHPSQNLVGEERNASETR